MKGIILDENLPKSLVLPSDLPVQHVSILGERPTDIEIWNYAEENELIIITKDSDFVFMMVAKSPPPKVVQLKIGNTKLKELSSLLEEIWREAEGSLKNAKLIIVHKFNYQIIA